MEANDQFWKDVTTISKSKLSIGADQLQKIIVYILMQTKMVDLCAHLKLAFIFSTGQLKLSRLGYFLTTLDACVEEIIALEDGLVTTAGMTTD